jgi:hypothetical protein
VADLIRHGSVHILEPRPTKRSPVEILVLFAEIQSMKSAYELAMERLQKNEPSVPLSAEQRAQIAEIDSLYTAKIAEKELLLKSEIAQEQAKGKFDQVEQVQKQLASELRRLNEEREEKKEKVRQGNS